MVSCGVSPSGSQGNLSLGRHPGQTPLGRHPLGRHPLPIACWDTPSPLIACCDTPPWTEFLINACENITFPQLLLRAVIRELVTYRSFAVRCRLSWRPAARPHPRTSSSPTRLSPLVSSRTCLKRNGKPDGVNGFNCWSLLVDSTMKQE